MKYIYIFQKENDDYELMNESGAYFNLYETSNIQNKMRYIGAVDEIEYLKSVPKITREVKAFKEAILNKDPDLVQSLEDNRMTGIVTMNEDEMSKEVNKFSKSLDDARTQDLIKIADKNIKPDKRSNVMTPGGRRNEILQQM